MNCIKEISVIVFLTCLSVVVFADKRGPKQKLNIEEMEDFLGQHDSFNNDNARCLPRFEIKKEGETITVDSFTENFWIPDFSGKLTLSGINQLPKQELLKRTERRTEVHSGINQSPEQDPPEIIEKRTETNLYKYEKSPTLYLERIVFEKRLGAKQTNMFHILFIFDPESGVMTLNNRAGTLLFSDPGKTVIVPIADRPDWEDSVCSYLKTET